MGQSDADRYAALMMGEGEVDDSDVRLFCLILAAENRDQNASECWVEMARRAYDFLTERDTIITDEGDNVIGLFRPER